LHEGRPEVSTLLGIDSGFTAVKELVLAVVLALADLSWTWKVGTNVGSWPITAT